MSLILLVATLLPILLVQQQDVRTFHESLLAAPQNEHIYRIVTRIKGLQLVPYSNVYGIYNADSTRFVAVVIKDSTKAPDGSGWFYNMRAVHGVMLNMRHYTAPQVFASQDVTREGAIATVTNHIGRNYGSILFWSTGMFASATSEQEHDTDVAAALKKYPKWGAFPSWVIKQAAIDY